MTNRYLLKITAVAEAGNKAMGTEQFPFRLCAAKVPKLYELRVPKLLQDFTHVRM